MSEFRAEKKRARPIIQTIRPQKIIIKSAIYFHFCIPVSRIHGSTLPTARRGFFRLKPEKSRNSLITSPHRRRSPGRFSTKGRKIDRPRLPCASRNAGSPLRGSQITTCRPTPSETVSPGFLMLFIHSCLGGAPPCPLRGRRYVASNVYLVGSSLLYGGGLKTGGLRRLPPPFSSSPRYFNSSRKGLRPYFSYFFSLKTLHNCRPDRFFSPASLSLVARSMPLATP